MITSVLVTAVSWWLSRRFGLILWQKFPWSKNPLKHILIVLAYILIFTAAIIGMVFVINLMVDGRTENYWQSHQRFHLIILLVFIFSVLIHEAVYLFFLWKKELTRSADLEKENIQSKFEALKNHVNPHFLFNSLGTLSSLINTDQEKATQYVNEFSKIYRYFLEVNSNDLVTLDEELAFIDSYIFLQKIRFGNGFVFNNHIDRKFYASYVLPLTLQLLIENALKHNTSDESKPLHIELMADSKREVLMMKNNVHLRSVENSTRTGLKNLEQRYLSFVGRNVVCRKTEHAFIVEIPLINNEQ